MLYVSQLILFQYLSTATWFMCWLFCHFIDLLRVHSFRELFYVLLMSLYLPWKSIFLNCWRYTYTSEIVNIYERPPKPPTFWNSYTRTLILDTIMKLSGTIGVTQKTMPLDTHVRLILLQTLNPQERWGTHKKRWPSQPRPFADVIGLVRCSHIYIYIYIIYIYIQHVFRYI